MFFDSQPDKSFHAPEPKPFAEIVEFVNNSTGLDLSGATVIAEYTAGDKAARRWILRLDDGEWVLLFDVMMASAMDLLNGSGLNSIYLASSPLFLLTADTDFNPLLQADVHDTVREALKTHGVKDGTPYLTITSVSPMQAMGLKAAMKRLGWNGVNVAVEPIGNMASGLSLYLDGETGDWKID